jgi:hypothetical protein
LWYLDSPEHDPDSNHRDPTAKQIIYADQARSKVCELKALLERVTVPQQREIIGKVRDELVGGVFRMTPLRLHPDQRTALVRKREIGIEQAKQTTSAAFGHRS